MVNKEPHIYLVNPYSYLLYIWFYDGYLVNPLYIWVNYNDLTVLPHWESWFIYGESSQNGRTIQVCELL